MIDFHVDTIYQLVINKSGESLESNSFAVDVRRMKKAGVKAICFALFTPEENNLFPSRWELFNALHDRFQHEMDLASLLIKQAYNASDIIHNETSAVLTVEDIGPLDGDDEKLELLDSWGVRIASLIWNNENAYAYPNSTDPAIMARGLKKKGHEAVEALSGMDIILDVSHLSDGGFQDVYDHGVKMVATHSDSRALCNHPRNLTDDMARKIAQRGGIIGMNVCPIFLRNYPADSRMEDCESRIQDMVDHIMHFYNVAGEDVIAIGSDLDGTEGSLELANVLDYCKLYDPLRKAGLSASQIEKFYYGNGLRVLA